MNNDFQTLAEVSKQFSADAGAFIVELVKKIAGDARMNAVLMAGSPLTGSVDRWSDVDLAVVCVDAHYADVMADRKAFAAGLGHLLSAFTGEHVGEPRLLICLYDNPLMHVDIKFIRIGDVNPRVENPLVLWDRTGEAARELAIGTPRWPNADLDWFEDRAWIWLHYGLSKVGRGEVYEALGMLSFFREQVLGPLIAKRMGRNQRGVRHLEKDTHLGDRLLRTTTTSLDRDALLEAYQASIDLYRELYASIAGKPNAHPAAAPVAGFLDAIRNA
jgi:hypothetical protein